MDKSVTENLFLLEFLVDSLYIAPCVCLGDVTAETCVSVQFLDNPPLDICENDFTPKQQYTTEPRNVKSGKSCLFYLTPVQAEKILYQFDVCVRILKKLLPSMEKIQIGDCSISLVNLFKELASEIVSSNNDKCPAAKTLKDTFKITNATGQVIGEIGMYIRISSFGKLIVTQFQMNLENKSVLFKDKEGRSLYRYKKANSKKDDQDVKMKELRNLECPIVPCPIVPCPNVPCPNVPCPNVPCPNVPCPNVPCPYVPCPSVPCPIVSCPSVPCPIVPYPRPAAETQTYPCVECEAEANRLQNPGCYQEIGAQMGKNAITLRVHKENHKLEETDNGSCCCTPGTFNIGNKIQSPSLDGSVGCGCGPAGEQNFTMRPPSAGPALGNDPITFKMGGCGLGAQNNVTVVPPVCTAPDGTQFTELSDPDRDVFILRIGKKSEGANKKNNLELELCTPKGPDIKPPPKMETQDTQWDDADALAAGGGKKSRKKKSRKRRSLGTQAKRPDVAVDLPAICGLAHFIGEPKPIKCVPPPPKPSVCSVVSQWSCASSTCNYCQRKTPSCRMWCC